MTEVEVRAERTIDAPAAAVWSVLATYDLDPTWRRGVRSMVPTPAGGARAGTTTVEVIAIAGRTYRNEGEVVAIDDGRRLAWRTTSGADADGERWVEPLGAGACRVGLALRARPRGLERVLAPVLRRVLHRNLAGDLDRLARLVATGGAASARPSAGAGATSDR